MDGKRSQQDPSISRLTSQPETIPYILAGTATRNSNRNPGGTARPEGPCTQIFAVAIDDHDLALDRLRAQKELPERAEIVTATEMYPEMLKDLSMLRGDILLLDSLSSRL